MKKKISLCPLFFLCALCGLSFATTNDELTSQFYSANKLYKQGRYEEAVFEYKKIIEKGYQSGPLYYNLGNCYFKLGSLGKTILYYEKAKRLIPRDPELRFNYNYVQSLLEDKMELPRKNWFTRGFLEIVGFFSLGKWLGLIITTWLILIISIIINIFIHGFRKAFRYTGIGLSVFLIILISCAITKYNIYSSPTAIILAKEVPVRYGPGEAEVEAFLLHEGTKAEIKKTQENWFQIQLCDGKSGWLPKDAVEWI